MKVESIYEGEGCCWILPVIDTVNKRALICVSCQKQFSMVHASRAGRSLTTKYCALRDAACANEAAKDYASIIAISVATNL